MPRLGLQEHVRSRHQGSKPLPTPFVVEVDDHAALAGVVVPPIKASILAGRVIVDERRIVTRRIAAWGLDKDYVRTHVGEQLAGQGDGFAGQFNHPQATQGAHTTPFARNAATSSTLNPNRRVSTSSVCSPRHGPLRGRCQSVSEKCAG